MNQSILCMKFLASPLPFDVTGILLNYSINDDKKCNYKYITQQSFTTYPASLPPKSHHTIRPPRRGVSFQFSQFYVRYVRRVTFWVTRCGATRLTFGSPQRKHGNEVSFKNRGHGHVQSERLMDFLNLAIHVWREWSEIISDLIQLENEIKLKNDIKNHMRCALLNRKWLWCSQIKFICTSGRKI